MNKTLKKIFIITIVFIAFSNAIIAQEKPKRIAILDVEAKNAPKAYAEIIRDLLEVKLLKSRLFDVLERNQTKIILDEQKFQMANCSDTICAVQIGKILYADLVIVGSLSKIAKYTLSLKIVDVKNGSIMLADSETAETDAELDKAATNIIDRIERDIQSNNYGAKSFASADSIKKSTKPMYFGVYYRYGLIPNMEIPSINVPASYPNPITLTTERRDNNLMEVMIAPSIELNNFIKLRPHFKGGYGIDKPIAATNTYIIYSSVIDVTLENKFFKYYSFGTGLNILFEYPFYRLIPYAGFGMGYSRYGNQGHYSLSLGYSLSAGNSDRYNITLDKQTNLIYTEIEIGFSVFLTESIGLTFSGIYNYTVYGNLFHDLKIKKAQTSGTIPSEYQDLDKKLNMNKFDDKKLSPIWYAQFGIVYKL